MAVLFRGVTTAVAGSVNIFAVDTAGKLTPLKGPFVTGNGPDAIVTADVNGDGNADLLISDQTAGDVLLLLGDGTGNFTPKGTFLAGTTPAAMVLGDLNGDGNLDLVVSNGAANAVSVLLGNGKGSFGTPRNFVTPAGAGALALADFNADGNLDVAVSIPTRGRVTVLKGDGKGGLVILNNYSIGGIPGSIMPMDVNGDGLVDLVVVRQRSHLLGILLNTSVSPTAPRLVSNSVVNAGGYQGGGVSPGEIVAVYGFNIGPATLAGLQLNPDGTVANIIVGAQALFDGVAAPLIYAQSGVVSAIVPYEVAGKTTTQLQMVYNGVKSNTIPLTVLPSVPALFTSLATGSGQGAILNQDLTINSAANPAAQGSVVVLYGTGEGQTTPAGTDGLPANGPIYPAPQLPVTVQIGNQPAQVGYVGAAPQAVAGLFQINVTLPAGIGSGNIPVLVKVGTATSQAGVTVAVK